MKKNAFTLIELIAVIVILSIVLTLSVPSLIGALKNNKEKSLKSINELIILAAKDYVVDYGLEIPRKITQNELCKNYLDCPIINPVTKEEMIFSVIVDENKNYTIDKNELIELKVVLNGGKLSKDISGGYTPNTEIILETPTRERHGFAGWEIVSGDAVIEGSVLKLGTKNSTLVANWTGTPVKLNVDLDGGTSSINYNSEYYTRNTLDLGTPTKANNMFVGWKLVSGDAVLSGNKLTFGYEDVNLKATWLKVVEEFAYTGSEQTYEILVSGYYKLEVWGAQGGGSNGGLGGYSTGTMFFKKGQKIYLNVGGTTSSGTGGYNGGGTVTGNVYGGGGATHIATSSGLLSSLSSSQSSILIVGSGGGGSGNGYAGGSGGGIFGVAGVGDDPGKAGTQTGGGAANNDCGGGSGSFGQGGTGSWEGEALGGGGAGFYGGGSGGGSANNGSGGGGSGYIGNDLLTDKAMYCYNCTTSTATSTLTYSTTNSSSAPTSKYAKQGSGYAKVSLLETSESDNRIIKNMEFDAVNKTEIFVAPLDGKYKLEVWGAQGGGSNGGYGAYSVGTILLIKNQKLYITVGEKSLSGIGGYNGGGSVTGNVYGGGGATHIATSPGVLSSLSTNQTSILIVAAGGGGSGNGYAGGSGGGIFGVAGVGDDPGKAGTQTGGGAANNDCGGGSGSFGQGGTGSWEEEALGGGGAGFYGGGSGGGSANNGSGGGGSSYIGNSLLTNKVMYCYNCTASSDTATKTISTTCTNAAATENCSKQGNGYAKVTYIGE